MLRSVQATLILPAAETETETETESSGTLLLAATNTLLHFNNCAVDFFCLSLFSHGDRLVARVSMNLKSSPSLSRWRRGEFWCGVIVVLAAWYAFVPPPSCAIMSINQFFR